MKVLVIGEVCEDRFVYCEANRLSPEAPVPVLKPIREVVNLGMAGNTVENVKALAPHYTTLPISPAIKITKTRYVEEKSNHMFLRVDEGEVNVPHFHWDFEIDQLLAEADIVIVSDYNKGYLRNGDLKDIARKSKLSILDSKRKLTDDLIEEFTFVKLNESERLNNPQLTTDNIITTLGRRGAEYKNVLFPSPNPQETIDVSGAGDTFTAAFIVKYFQLGDEGIAIKFANRKAAEVVTKRGVTTPSNDE